MNPDPPPEIGPEPGPGPAAAPTTTAASPARWRPSPADLAALALVAAAIGWSYAPNIASLVRTWNREPDYSHGFLVVPLALFIFWKSWRSGPAVELRGWAPGWALVVGSLAARAWFHERNQTWSESATLLGAVVGLALARMGPSAMRRTWPAFAFLIFLYPLPPQINATLSQPLQGFATWCACSLLRLTGLWVMPEGNVILVGNDRLEVAAACNGLSMLMSLAATVAATASLVPMANYKRIALLLSIVPIALGSNVLRISATAWCYHRFGAEVGNKYAHDLAGWLMMPTAMLLVGLELSLISWLIVESEETAGRPGRLLLGGNPAPRVAEGRP